MRHALARISGLFGKRALIDGAKLLGEGRRFGSNELLRYSMRPNAVHRPYREAMHHNAAHRGRHMIAFTPCLALASVWAMRRIICGVSMHSNAAASRAIHVSPLRCR